MASHNAPEHLEHLRGVFARLKDHSLRIHPAKCILGVTSLGFHVDQHGIRPMNDKVQVIRDFPLPTTQRKLRQFLGLVNFFLPSCAQILQPLHDLLKTAPKGNYPPHMERWCLDCLSGQKRGNVVNLPVGDVGIVYCFCLVSCQFRVQQRALYNVSFVYGSC